LNVERKPAERVLREIRTKILPVFTRRTSHRDSSIIKQRQSESLQFEEQNDNYISSRSRKLLECEAILGSI